MLTTVHQPFDTRIFHKESKSLIKAGHSVTVVAPSDYSGEEYKDGIKVITVKKPSSKILHPLTMLRAFSAGYRHDYDVYHCHEPGSLFVCTLLKLLKRNKMIYDAHEHYPSLIADNSLFPRFLKKYVEFISNINELFLSKFADSLIVVRNDLLHRFRKVTNKKIRLIYVYPTKDVFNNVLPSKELISKYSTNKIIIYEGYVDISSRGIDVLLFALKEIVVQIPQVKLLIVGKMPDSDLRWVERYVNENNLNDNFEMVGWVDYNKLPEYIQISDVGVMLLQPVRYNNIMGIPNKIFDYMAGSIPTVASDFPNIGEIITSANAGMLVNPTDVNEIKEAITNLLINNNEAKILGENGKRMIESTYNWDLMEKELCSVYKELESK